MNIIFFGNGDFGINTIKLLKKSNYNILSVISDESKKSGRGLKKNRSNLTSCVESLNINLIKKDNISDPDFISKLYYSLLRCLEEEPNNRYFLFI